MSELPILEIKNLSVAFITPSQKKTVVEQLNFKLFKGQCLALVGESGSGKTLTALAIMQLLPYSAGISLDAQILWKENNILNFSEKKMRTLRGRKISLIFQDASSSFNPVLTIGHQINEVHRKGLHQTVKLFNEVGMPNPTWAYYAYPHQLSGGMRQRAMIAMALAGEPEIIIADEPTTALDVTIQAQILQLLNKLQQSRGMGLLFISHDLAVVSQVADDIIVLQKGRCIEANSKNAFFKKPQQAYSKALLDSVLSNQTHLNTPLVTKPILTVNNLTVHYKKFCAVQHINFSLAPSRTLALVGESGSGKTTTAQAILKLIPLTSGTIIFNGISLSAIPKNKLRHLRREMQIIFQDPYSSLNPRMMIAESMIEGLATQKIIKGRKRQLAHVDELLKKVGLLPHYKWRYPHELSGGERQRICIARVLALKPKLIILDEPTSALDATIQKQILQLLLELQQTYQIAYLLITHNLSVVAYMSHYLAVMHEGEIVEQGPTPLLLENPKHAYTKQLLAAVPKLVNTEQ